MPSEKPHPTESRGYAPVLTRWYDDLMGKLGSQNIEGKTIAITGCTTGIGRIVAATAAHYGARHVLLLNRASARAADVDAHVRAIAPPPTSVTSMDCDLQSFASVRNAATLLKAACEGSGLDILYLNAGVMA